MSLSQYFYGRVEKYPSSLLAARSPSSRTPEVRSGGSRTAASNPGIFVHALNLPTFLQTLNRQFLDLPRIFGATCLASLYLISPLYGAFELELSPNCYTRNDLPTEVHILHQADPTQPYRWLYQGPPSGLKYTSPAQVGRFVIYLTFETPQGQHMVRHRLKKFIPQAGSSPMLLRPLCGDDELPLTELFTDRTKQELSLRLLEPSEHHALGFQASPLVVQTRRLDHGRLALELHSYPPHTSVATPPQVWAEVLLQGNVDEAAYRVALAPNSGPIELPSLKAGERYEVMFLQSSDASAKENFEATYLPTPPLWLYVPHSHEPFLPEFISLTSERIEYSHPAAPIVSTAPKASTPPSQDHLTPVSAPDTLASPESQDLNDTWLIVNKKWLETLEVEEIETCRPYASTYAPKVTSGFGPRKDPFKGGRRHHYGIDYGLPEGAPVLAPGPGVVAGLGRGHKTRGNYVKVHHPGPNDAKEFETRYYHLSSIGKGLKIGSPVSIGDRLGKVGKTGRATGPHLHFEIRAKDSTDLAEPTYRAKDPSHFVLVRPSPVCLPVDEQPALNAIAPFAPLQPKFDEVQSTHTEFHLASAFQPAWIKLAPSQERLPLRVRRTWARFWSRLRNSQAPLWPADHGR